MKSIVIRTLLVIALLNVSQTIIVRAQTSCCSAPRQFALLAGNAQFRMLHEEPKQDALVNPMGTMQGVTVGTGVTALVYKVIATSPSNATILVFHEWWGLNDNIKDACDQIARAVHGKATVIGIDLYQGKIATTRNDAAALMQNSKEDYSRQVIAAVLATVPQDQRIGTVGWCFGGGWSLQASIMAGERGAACVMYYGMPEFDQTALKKLNAPVLGIFATKDAWITQDLVSKFEVAMNEAGKVITIRNYDADHAFANPSNAHHDGEAMKDAFKRTIDFFEEHLLK